MMAVLHRLSEMWQRHGDRLKSFPPHVHVSTGRNSDSTAHGRRVPLSVHDYRAFRWVQAILQTATTEASNHQLVS